MKRNRDIDPLLVKDKLVQLKRLKTRLEKVKKEEMALRCEIAEFLTDSKPAGSHKYHIDDFDVVVKKNQTISLDKKLLEDVYDDFNEDETSCIKFEPKLIEGEYKKLDPKLKQTLDQCIVIKPAAPTIEFK